MLSTKATEYVIGGNSLSLELSFGHCFLGHNPFDDQPIKDGPQLAKIKRSTRAHGRDDKVEEELRLCEDAFDNALYYHLWIFSYEK